MNESPKDFLADVELTYSDKIKQRKQSVPAWIKIFSWIFLIIGALTPFMLLIGISGGTASIALYGLETNEPLSLIGIILSLLFIFKAIVAFGLIWAKDWGAYAGLIDGIVGSIICIALILLGFMNNTLNLRLELIALIPYTLKMSTLRKTW